MSVTIDQRDVPRTRSARLLRLVMWVALAHVVAILVLSPQIYWPSRNTPEAMFERGEQAMKEGKYVEAMELFRKVMDQQPKPPPIYTKAAEQHRMAERMGKEAAGREKAEKEASATTRPTEAAVTSSATRPVAPPPASTTTQPAKPFIPPELMPR